MWAGFFVLLVAERIGGIWGWVRDLPLVAELPCLGGALPLVARRVLSGRVPGRAGFASCWCSSSRWAGRSPRSRRGSKSRRERSHERQAGLARPRRSCGRRSAVRARAPVPATAPALGRDRRRGRRDRCPATNSSPNPPSTRPARSRSTRPQKPCGRGWCRSAPGGPASTATTSSTTPPALAPSGSCPSTSEPRSGDWVPMASKVNQTTAFKIKALEPNRWMLWAKPHSTWAWQLPPLEGGRTRLVTRLKERYEWRSSPGLALLTLILVRVRRLPDDAQAVPRRETACRAPRRQRAGSPLHSADAVSAR